MTVGSLRFSEQQFIDCVNSANGMYYSQGCTGGWPHEAMNYMAIQNTTINSLYPFVGAQQKCDAASVDGNGFVARALGGGRPVVPARNEAALIAVGS
jgi:hypothetical protein